MTTVNWLLISIIVLTDTIDRLNNFIICLTNNSPAQQTPITGNCSQCYRYPGKPTELTFSVNCKPNTPPGRYLVILLSSRNALDTLEVEVYKNRKIALFNRLFSKCVFHNNCTSLHTVARVTPCDHRWPCIKKSFELECARLFSTTVKISSFYVTVICY